MAGSGEARADQKRVAAAAVTAAKGDVAHGDIPTALVGSVASGAASSGVASVHRVMTVTPLRAALGNPQKVVTRRAVDTASTPRPHVVGDTTPPSPTPSFTPSSARSSKSTAHTASPGLHRHARTKTMLEQLTQPVLSSRGSKSRAGRQIDVPLLASTSSLGKLDYQLEGLCEVSDEPAQITTADVQGALRVGHSEQTTSAEQVRAIACPIAAAPEDSVARFDRSDLRSLPPPGWASIHVQFATYDPAAAIASKTEGFADTAPCETVLEKVGVVRSGSRLVLERVEQVVGCASKAVVGMSSTAREAAAEPRVQVAGAVGAGAAVMMGAGGGVAGMVGGGVLGGTLGVLSAPFTFGLSIPVAGAVLGAAGGVTGVVLGGGVGLVGGGVAGYSAYDHRDVLSNAARVMLEKVGSSTVPLRRLLGDSSELSSDGLH